MKPLNSVTAAIIFFMFYGCLQIHPTSSNPTPATKVVQTQPTKASEPKTEQIPTELTTQPASHPGQYTKQHTSTEDIQAATKNPDQIKIDQALELCTFAQQMWEQGNLEDAISNLDAAYFLILEIDHHVSEELSQQKEDLRYLISKRILEIYASRQIVVTGQYEAIPIPMNVHVKKEIKRLTGPEKKFFIAAMERAAMYRPFILEELKKAGLPEEISWLPLIESGFQIRALSSARALGLWQFIPSTGHKFGLNRNHYIDERMDPEKSTRAAISYLKELHNLFGDWSTALAAYNCGEYRVLKTIRRQRINYLDNFWDLYQNLPRETARYVPRFLATVHIVNNLEKYNITLKHPQSPIPYETFNFKKQVWLKDIAKEIGTSTKLLKRLNPELRLSLLPPDTYPLRIPASLADVFLAKLDNIKSSYTPPPMYIRHRVRKGDTLSGIAKKYHTSVKRISSCNRIVRNRIIAGKVLKIPTRNYSGWGTHATAPTKTIPAGKSIKYTVRKGDNLWQLAKQFSVTTKQIKTENGLKNTKLSIGQILTISPGKVPPQGKTTYQVKSGDSPFIIAQKHNMSLNRFLTLNRLSKRSKIYPGQRLFVDTIN
ncbi:MAG: lytic transglycosylase [Desulfobacterales bacterium]|nr:MAG: lytic transglycosylase [Desulfobacterales bacterium]